MSDFHLLVAEDDQFYNKIYQTELAAAGIPATVVGDGQQALDFIAKQAPSLILLDLIMPVKDGFEVLEALHADPNLSKIPVVVMSNLGQESDVERAKSLGAQDYFVKANVSFQDVLAKIRAHMPQGATPAPAASPVAAPAAAPAPAPAPLPPAPVVQPETPPAPAAPAAQDPNAAPPSA
jgi:CheY-like chemotaxis protein